MRILSAIQPSGLLYTRLSFRAQSRNLSLFKFRAIPLFVDAKFFCFPLIYN